MMIRSTLYDFSLASLAFLGPTLASLAWPQLTRHSSRSRSVPAYPTLATLAWHCACCARSAAKGPARPSSFAGQARQPVRHLPGFARPVASCWPGQPGGQLRWPSGFGLFDYFLPGIPSGCTTLIHTHQASASALAGRAAHRGTEKGHPEPEPIMRVIHHSHHQ